MLHVTRCLPSQGVSHDCIRVSYACPITIFRMPYLQANQAHLAGNAG
jgi:hypothetical protein